MSLSIKNLRSAMAFSRLQLRTSGINATASPEAAIVDSLSRLGLHWNRPRARIALAIVGFTAFPYSEGLNSNDHFHVQGIGSHLRAIPNKSVGSP
jgi:hypothetical protein